MACQCISLTDTALAEHNTELGVIHLMSAPGWQQRIAITTNVLVKQRGAKPVRIVAKFCPLCGVSYEQPPAGQGGGDE